MKTEKVVSNTGNVWWRYADDASYKEIHKRVYGNELKRYSKCRKLFLKNLQTVNKPHTESLRKYKPNTEELEYVRRTRGEAFAESIELLQDKISGIKDGKPIRDD